MVFVLKLCPTSLSCPGLENVLSDLSLQGVDGRKSSFIANFGNEKDFDVGSVELTVQTWQV
jgi:hypothetical protein